MKTQRKIMSAIAVSSLVLLASCGQGGGSSQADTAVMYSSNNETTLEVVSKAAQDSEAGIKVDIVTGSSGPLLQRIASEASSPAADLFYSAPASALADFAEYAEPYRSPETSAIDDELVDSQERWTATNAHVVAFMVNTQQTPEGASYDSWADLLDPAWNGKIMAPNPEQSSTGLTALYGAYKILGEADFAKLMENVTLTESTSNVYPAVAQGEYALSIGYEANIYPYIAGGQPGVEMVYPADGTFLEHDAVMLVKDGPNPEAGKAMVDVILSKEAQEENLRQSFRRPSRNDIEVSSIVDFADLSDLTIVDIHEDGDDDGRETFLEFMKSL